MLPSSDELMFDSASCTPIFGTGTYQMVTYTSSSDVSKNVLLNITVSDLDNPIINHVEFCKTTSTLEADYTNTMDGKMALKKTDKGIVLKFKDVKFQLSDGVYILNGEQLFETTM